MNNAPSTFFKHLAGPVLSLALATTGHATVTQDQYFDALGSSGASVSVWGLTIGGHEGQQLAQTFTAGLSGLLTRVDLQIGGHRGGFEPLTDPVTFSLRTAPGGTELAHTSIAVADLPEPAWPGEFVAIDLSAFGITVQAGQSYTIQLTSANPYETISWFTADTHPNDNAPALYGGGSMHYFHDGQWLQHADLLEADSGFKTYVDTVTPAVPEPSTGWLSLAGITGLMMVRRRRQA